MTARAAPRASSRSGSRTESDGKQSNGRPIAIGVADHSGWAILVATAVVNGSPTVVDRRRVPLIERGVPTQPYHHDTVSLGEAEAEQLLRRVKRSVAASTALAFDRLSADLSPRYRIVAVTIREATLPRLPATAAEAHRSYHVFCRADGMLYHTAVCKAAGDRGWQVAFHRRGEELAIAAAALRASEADVERYLDDLGHSLKSPWTTEHRRAFAAALGSLRQQSRIRALRPAD